MHFEYLIFLIQKNNLNNKIQAILIQHYDVEGEVFLLNSYSKLLSFENDIYKQLYEESKQRRNQINNKLTPTITIITSETVAILWIVFKIINNIKIHNNVIMLQHLCPIIFSLIAICLWIVSITFLVICLTHYNFVYLDPTKIDICIQDNKNYLQYYLEEEVLSNIKFDITEGYKNMCIENWIKTNKHSEYFRKCYIFLISTLGFIIINFLLVLLF